MHPTPLYDLLTDKDGNPLRVDPRGRHARVGYKQRMGPGRWPHVLDPETKEPLVFSLADSFANFHRLVGGREGFYQLPILDENYQLIDKELIGYLTITPPLAPASVIPDGLDPIVARMVGLLETAVNRAFEVCERMVEQNAATVAANAELVRANAEGARTTQAHAPRNAAPAPTAEADDDDEPTVIESLICQGATGLDMWWQTRKLAKEAEADSLLKKRAAKAQAEKPASEKSAAEKPAAGAAHADAAPTTPPPPANAAPPTQEAPPPPPTETKVTLTDEQREQMAVILAKLTGREQLAVTGMVMRMSDETRAELLAEFSTLTVDQAVERIREFLPEKLKGGAK